MSTWTHVVGCIRIDGIPHGFEDCDKVEDIEKIFGPMCLYDAWNEESTLPRGSEGSLQYRIIEYYTGLPWLAVPIWGDLRDYDSVEEIKEWFNGILSKLDFRVRDAVLHVQVECEEPVILTYKDEP